MALQHADIRDHWKEVQPQLERLGKKSFLEFFPESCFSLCVTEKASFWIDLETGAFCLLQETLDSLTGKPILYVYAAVCPVQIEVEDYVPQLKQLAAQIGAQAIQMHSPRKGFLKDPEWTLKYCCYERTV